MCVVCVYTCILVCGVCVMYDCPPLPPSPWKRGQSCVLEAVSRALVPESSLCGGSLHISLGAAQGLPLREMLLLWVNAVGTRAHCLASHGGQSQAFRMQGWRGDPHVSPGRPGSMQHKPRSRTKELQGQAGTCIHSHLQDPWVLVPVSHEPQSSPDQAKESAIVAGSSRVESPHPVW